MFVRLQQTHAEGQISLEDDRNIRFIRVLSNLVMALVAGTVGMVISFGWILLA